MAEIHATTMTPSKVELLADWLPRQRWFAGKGRAPVLRRLGGYRLDDPAGEVGIEIVILADSAGPEPVVYQVPLTYRGAPLPGGEHALVGTAEHGVLGTRWVYDALHDDVAVAELVRLITGRAVAQAQAVSDTPDPGVAGHRVTGGVWPSDLRLARSAVLVGEQSNTSVICEVTDADGVAAAPVIVKVFRTLQAGENPDVTVQTALAQTGSPYVPATLGSIEGYWADPADGAEVRGHLAFAQRFLPGVEDAWRVALRAAGAGEDFTAWAHELGSATAHIHATLAEVLGSREAAESDRLRIVAQVRARAHQALAEVPGLMAHSVAVAGVLEELEHLALPPVQRVHGDYHLGQVLRAPSGWVALDFEGEPLRPLAERSLPDVALRDVAGMLRSIDYVGGSVTLSGTVPAPDAAAWVAATQAAFLAGYDAVQPAGLAPWGALLRALQLDKALYEAVYEHRNRPDWLGIPVLAVGRLLAGGPDAGPAGGGTGGGYDRTTERDGAPGHHERRRIPMAASSSGPVRPLEVDHALLGPVARGEVSQPHDVLGPHLHPGSAAVTIRVRRPLADAVTVLVGGERHAAAHEIDGVWAAVIEVDDVPDYRIEAVYGDDVVVGDDPYRFLPTLGQVDLHLIGEGRHERLWEALGAHVRTYDSVMGEVVGVSFAVWAPNARAVRVVGDFNFWDGQGHALRSLGSSGVWELFVPGVEVGARYKYQILGADGTWNEKADPLAQATEVPPSTASVVTQSAYSWGDDDWLERRGRTNPHTGPMSVYEVHLGSWKKGLSYREAADQLAEYVSWLGFTHVELMPVAEHPFGGSWGYQVTSYFAPTARFGVPDDLRYLVDRLHQAGIGVIVDWVPAHFPKDSWALARFDGTALYEDPDPMRGEQRDWGTYVFNFGRREVRNFLVANAAYWLQEFHVDGLRVDAVASMLYLDYSRGPGQWRPNEFGGRENLEAISFLQEANAVAYRVAPGVVTIAEESTSFPGVTTPTSHGGLGFGLKWNMGWMNDTLRYIAEDPVNRRYHHGELTFSLVYAFSEQFLLPFSHDEVVHGKGSLLGKMPGDHASKLAGVRGLLAYQWSHPGKQLLFMGQEFAQAAEWSEERGLDWWHLDDHGHRGVAELVRRLNTIYREHPALWAEDFSHAGFEWLDANAGDQNVLAYLRRAGDDVVVVVQSFAGTTHEDYRIGLPSGGAWREILNTDASDYGGYGVGNLGRVEARSEPHHGRSHSAVIRVPALGAVWLTPEP